MKERPILFSGPMVRAILDGRKTQTRRIIKTRSKKAAGFDVVRTGVGAEPWPMEIDEDGMHLDYLQCPYGEYPDRLYVKETYTNGYPMTSDPYLYRATYHGGASHKWKPSIFMPKIASRIKLANKIVSVEKLHDITESDAIAEGAYEMRDWPGMWTFGVGFGKFNSPVMAFHDLWMTINGCDSWNNNPWIWRIKFEVIP